VPLPSSPPCGARPRLGRRRVAPGRRLVPGPHEDRTAGLPRAAANGVARLPVSGPPLVAPPGRVEKRAGLPRVRRPGADLRVDRQPGADLRVDRQPGAGLLVDRQPGADLALDKRLPADLWVDRQPGADLPVDR
jgi:hypothetical protein